ncbi:MAG TPA: hemerythrin family protein [Bryobacteraceae bacterium]|nr:hemerythrin family protein [Bryobacteraceae bacterium]
MQHLKWSVSHAVFVTEIDDEHREIFDVVGKLQTALAAGATSMELREITERLIACAQGHFAHEERLMRASRYGSFAWHKRQHDTARRRVQQLVPQIDQGDSAAGAALVEFLTSWLRDHTRLADRMLGAFLRNRNLGKLTIRATTKPTNQHHEDVAGR